MPVRSASDVVKNIVRPSYGERLPPEDADYEPVPNEERDRGLSIGTGLLSKRPTVR